MNKTILALGILAIAGSCAIAQDATPLSDRGVGYFTSFAGSRSAGMGNAGIALIGNGFLSRLNPATWIGLENVQITGTYDFSGVSSIDDQINSSSYSANGNFGGGIFALPVDRSLGISIAAGFTPVSSYNYQINSTDSMANLTGSSYTFNRKGAGGLGEGFVGASVSPIAGIGLGAMFQYDFGRTEATSSTSFISNGYQGAFTDNSMYLRGPSGTLGFILGNFDKLTNLGFLKGLDIAGYYKYQINLAGTYEIQSTYSDGLDTVFSKSSSGYIPPEFGIGLSKVFNNGLGVVLDVRSQQLSKYTDSFTPAGSLKDVLFIGGGVEYLQGRDIGSLFAKRVWRAGIYYSKTQFEVPDRAGQENQLDEIFATAGVELPVSYTATIDFAAQYGFRGLSSDLLYHERIFRLYVTVTMGEAWFLRPTGE